MLFCSILVFSLVPRLTSAQSTGTTTVPLLQPTDGPDHGLDLGHIGSTIGGASAGAVGVVITLLAFAMLRWSRKQQYLYHNKELGGIVPPLHYRKRIVDVETSSVDSFEVLRFPEPALLPPNSHGTTTTPTMHETHFGPPPSYSDPNQPSLDYFP